VSAGDEASGPAPTDAVDPWRDLPATPEPDPWRDLPNDPEADPA